MQIIKAGYIYQQGQFVADRAIAFDTTIKAVGEFEALRRRFPDATVRDHSKQIVIPGLINPHVHLEFCANKTKLRYGDFMSWLDSVIENREAIVNDSTPKVINKQLKKMRQSGTTTIGAISSLGLEMQSCVETKQKVVFFNELIGSAPAMVDALFQDFLGRLQSSQSKAGERFIPAMAIHSPYSVHPILLKRALKVAKEQSLPLSAHFLESAAEKEWLAQSTGGFAGFFAKFFNQSGAVNDADSFLDSFESPTLFTHCNYADKAQREKLKNHYITHCPVSNRLLGNKRLQIDDLDNLLLATDGLSSNNSLSLFDEMRMALMLHEDMELNALAHKLLEACTHNAGKALGLQTGEIKEGYAADLNILKPMECENVENMAVQVILHTKTVAQTFIDGEEV